MGFCPPPVQTGDPARDRRRFREWLRAREQEATFQLVCLVGIGAMIAAAVLGWFWSFVENSIAM